VVTATIIKQANSYHKTSYDFLFHSRFMYPIFEKDFCEVIGVIDL